ncbi:MAG: hypothetical protein L3J21_11655 [Devosiaceae bacterium]|nr:hypothetical protein [Devosiaceae bacterium]
MNNKKIKSFFAVAVLAASMAMTASPAFAWDQERYDDCVSRMWDPIGCALIEWFGSTRDSGGFDIKDGSKINEETQARVKEMMADGAFKSLADFKVSDELQGEMRGVTLVRIGEMDDLLSMFEKGADPEELIKNFYEQVK